MSCPVSAETKKIKWVLPSTRALTDVVYIDNVTIAKDEIVFVEIYPKGLQETYVGGFPVQFKAVAMRGDRSVIPESDLNINYSVTGNGSVDENGLFVPAKSGYCTLKASVSKKTDNSSYCYCEKSDIKVHGENYLNDLVIIADRTFTGRITSCTSSDLDSENIKYDYECTPKGERFNADGFFVLKGNTKVPLFINIIKNDKKSTYLVTKPGDFYKRIWLRYGPGEYRVEVCECPDLPVRHPKDEKYKGDVCGDYNGLIANLLTVTNTNRFPESSATWLMPSDVAPSDSLIVSNVAHSILSNLPANASDGENLRAIHDWELYNLYYDYFSINHPNQRKSQNADYVLKYRTGVCEGYYNLYASLVRQCGIKIKFFCEYEKLDHVWNQVYYNNDWYLVDVIGMSHMLNIRLIDIMI